MSAWRSAAVGLATALASAAAWAGQTTWIAGTPQTVGPQANGTSATAERIVGTDLFSWGWHWTAAQGVVRLEGFGGELRAGPAAASGDGATIVGSAQDGSGRSVPFRHSEAEGFVALGPTPPPGVSGGAHDVSYDGSVIVGNVGSEPFRWTAAGGMQPLSGALGSSARAWGVSDDGSVVVGWVLTPSQVVAYRWTAATGMQSLGTLPDHENSAAQAVSADGSVIVGEAYDEETATHDAFRWTAEGGMVSIGRLPGAFEARPGAVSADGSVVVGQCGFPDPDFGERSEPFVWTAATGMVTLAGYLDANGVDPAPSPQSELRAISSDGRVLVGWEDGYYELRSFRIDLDAAPARVPGLAPAARAALAGALVAGAMLAIKRRKSRT